MELSNSAINKLGDVIRGGDKKSEYAESVKNLNAWREMHGEIMDHYYDECVNLIKDIDCRDIIVAQRLKRLPTIIGKLNRFKKMRLSSMQDIAGVRIIVPDMKRFGEVEKRILMWNNLVKISDYVDSPKSSGYRGKHFVFKNDGMFVEIQLRTQVQHLWATAVETTDVFRGSSLKEKNDDTYWYDFFRQVSAMFSIIEETKIVCGFEDMNIYEICSILKANMDENAIDAQLRSFALTTSIVDGDLAKGVYYVILNLDFKKKKARIFSYKETEYNKAFRDYQKLEQKSSSNNQTVLVAVNKVKYIKEAYPNYFMSLDFFLKIVTFMLEIKRKKV